MLSMTESDVRVTSGTLALSAGRGEERRGRTGQKEEESREERRKEEERQEVGRRRRVEGEETEKAHFLTIRHTQLERVGFH